MKKISLTKGQFVIVDSEDFEKLNRYKWRARWSDKNKSFYGVRTTHNKETKKYNEISMAREILGLKKGDKRQSDHINHNTLDNRRCNLRICTKIQNKQNGKPYKGTVSIYKGVCRHKSIQKWQARIRYNNKLIHLGYFDNEIEAAKIYDEAAIKLFGKFAYPNFTKVVS